MTRPLVLAAALTVSALAAPTAARSQPVSDATGPDTYLDVYAGGFVPQHADLDGYDARVAFGGSFGAYFDEERHLGVEGGVGYHRATAESAQTTAAGRRVATSVLGIIPITASLRLRLPAGRAEIHALGGVGLYVAGRRSTVDLDGTSIESSTDGGSAFGFHLGAGVAFPVWSTTFVGVEARRSVVRARLDGVGTRLDGLTAAITISYQL